jgi:hypothetical protein
LREHRIVAADNDRRWRGRPHGGNECRRRRRKQQYEYNVKRADPLQFQLTVLL